MSTRPRITISKTSLCGIHENSSDNDSNKNDYTQKITNSRRILVSKRLPSANREGKTCSTGIIDTKKDVQPRKTSKSDNNFDKNSIVSSIDLCKKCGDSVQKPASKVISSESIKSMQHKLHNIPIKPKTSIEAKNQLVSKVISSESIKSIKHKLHNIPIKSKTSIEAKNQLVSKVISSETIKSIQHKCHNIPLTSKTSIEAKNQLVSKDISSESMKSMQHKCHNIPMKSKISIEDKHQSVQQYFLNQNFKRSCESVPNDNLRKLSSLHTINEQSESQAKLNDQYSDSIFKICTEASSSDEAGFLDTHSEENIQKLKEFRLNNYFECHSVKSRVENQVNVTNLVDHKCTYRFYLNDRLFPVPINKDHQNNIRCVECNLPLDLKTERDLDKTLNGSIQAKVQLIKDKEVQDLTLLLPVHESLVIKEKRKEPNVKTEVVYFGVIKLNETGHSIFNPVMPADSLALKYQKGYKDLENDHQVRYVNNDNDNIVYI